MDNLFVGNVGPSCFQWNLIAGVVVQCPSPCPVTGGIGPALTLGPKALWKSFRNDPGQGSNKRPKLTGLKSESLPGFIPES